MYKKNSSGKIISPNVVCKIYFTNAIKYIALRKKFIYVSENTLHFILYSKHSINMMTSVPMIFQRVKLQYRPRLHTLNNYKGQRNLHHIRMRNNEFHYSNLKDL